MIAEEGPAAVLGAAALAAPALAAAYTEQTYPLLAKYCGECHSAKKSEGDIDLLSLTSWNEARAKVALWQKMDTMLATRQMPPPEARQPAAEELARLASWVRAFLRHEARAREGDPGYVVLRRLNNAEYTYTVRDLTGVASLTPAREFPLDSAAGEGFANAGAALSISPALFGRYLAAGNELAEHAVLLPEGIRFSPAITRRDFTNEALAQIREFYRSYCDPTPPAQVRLQGLVWETNDGGRVPLERYLAALLAERDGLAAGTTQWATVARQRGLSPKYLARLSEALQRPNLGPLLGSLGERFRQAGPNDGPKLAAEIDRWQKVLWKFNSVGHLGKVGGPKLWQEPVELLASAYSASIAMPEPNTAAIPAAVPVSLPAGVPEGDVILVLASHDAGDGATGDAVIWESPRFERAGSPALPLRDVRAVCAHLLAQREQILAGTEVALELADAFEKAPDEAAHQQLLRESALPGEVRAAWLAYLGLGTSATNLAGELFTARIDSTPNYAFVKGWGASETPLVLASSSDEQVRIPGIVRSHSVVVHPSPTLNVVVSWRSPVSAAVRVEGSVTHAHPECGNGVTWALELRRGATRRRLASGVAQGGAPVPLGPLAAVAVEKGDFVSLLVGPRDRDHSCDLTQVEFNLVEPGEQGRQWNLAREVSPDILSGNPHADAHGNAAVWHFGTEGETPAVPLSLVPAGSLLARWQAATSATEKKELAAAVKRLLTSPPPAEANGPDAQLRAQLTSLGGPLLTAARQALAADRGNAGGEPAAAQEQVPWGLPAERFGPHSGIPAAAENLVMAEPGLLEIRLPADLVAGWKFVARGVLANPAGREGSVQMQALLARPEAVRGPVPGLPVVVAEGSGSRRRWEEACREFRELFPAALCYSRIVPVDEVVTLTLFHREDEPLVRLMLDEGEAARLERLWQELRFISQDALTLVDAFEQLLEFASQDGDPKLFLPLREPI